jgi:hypothetical protein
VPLPRAPFESIPDVDGAALGSDEDGLVLSVVDRAPSDAEPSLVRTFRWAGDAWVAIEPEKPLLTNRGAQVVTTAGRQICTVTPLASRVTTHCLRGRQWGPPVSGFKTTHPEPNVAFGGAFSGLLHG